MNTIMTIQSGTEIQNFAVEIFFEKDFLRILSSHSFRRELMVDAPLRELQHLYFDEFIGGKRVSFVYQNKHYFFYQNGTGVIEYLQQHLVSEAV